ncbi:MAG: hypothetical protein U0167_02900 [bacterium]
MKTPAASWCVGAALLAFATGAHAFVPNPKAASNLNHLPKGSAVSVPTPIHIDQGGDTIASALPIGALPFVDSGTTAGYVDNYAPTCGFANGAPDVVYSITPSAAQAGEVRIHLCGSSYDTELYVYADVQGNVIGCNDDSCGLQSELTVTFAVGHTYYVIVDGYYNYSGAYQITVDAPVPPCVVTCPAGSLLEGEPVCADNYYDSYNGGCNSAPPAFTSLPFPIQRLTVCGTYGGFFYAGLSYRDTDWYEIHVPIASQVIWTVRGETDTLCGIINGNTGCPVTSFYAYAYGAKCTDLTVSANVGTGTWWLWAGTLNFGTVAGPCGQHYTATLSGGGIWSAVQPTDWGTLKNLYR